MSAALVYVDVYQSRPRKLLGRPQTWRWRARNGGNFRVLAKSSEAYTNKADAIDTVIQLFGSASSAYLREAERGELLLRAATSL